MEEEEQQQQQEKEQGTEEEGWKVEEPYKIYRLRTFRLTAAETAVSDTIKLPAEFIGRDIIVKVETADKFEEFNKIRDKGRRLY
jgi:hypothetical protein